MADPRENPNLKAELDKAMGRTPTSGDPDSKSTGVPSEPESKPHDVEQPMSLADHFRGLIGMGSGKTPEPRRGPNGKGVMEAVDEAVNGVKAQPTPDPEH